MDTSTTRDGRFSADATTKPPREDQMAKRGRKKRDRKNSKANHGKRPNAGAKK